MSNDIKWVKVIHNGPWLPNKGGELVGIFLGFRDSGKFKEAMVRTPDGFVVSVSSDSIHTLLRDTLIRIGGLIRLVYVGEVTDPITRRSRKTYELYVPEPSPSTLPGKPRKKV